VFGISWGGANWAEIVIASAAVCIAVVGIVLIMQTRNGRTGPKIQGDAEASLASDRDQGTPGEGQVTGLRPALVILIILVVLLMVYGVVQPAVLRLDHVKGDEDLQVADVISILVTVLALLTTSVGVLIYTVVNRSMDQRLQRSVRKARRELSKAIASAKTEAAQERSRAMTLQWSASIVDAWQRLEPLLREDITSENAQRDEIVEYGINCTRYALASLEGASKEQQQNLGPRAHLNLAFFLACDALTRGATAPDPKAAEALQNISDGQFDFFEDRDTVAWVNVCCNPRASAAWQSGRDEALAVLELPGPSQAWKAAARTRYQAAFNDFFTPRG
jgi:hypothetical protein